MIDVQRIGYALLILVGAYIVSTIVMAIVRRSNVLTERTQTTLDDVVMKRLGGPVHLGFQVAGVLWAVAVLFPDLSYNGYGHGDLAFLLVALWAGYAANRLLRGIIGWYENESVSSGDVDEQRNVFGFFETMITIAVWSIAALLVLNHFGVEISALLAGLGVAGIAVALALQNTLSGVFSAFYLALDKPVRLGDYVELDDGTDGFVEDISMRSTRIRTFSNNLVVVPNTKLSQMIIKNYYLPEEEVGVVIPVSVSYDADLEVAENVAIEVAKRVVESHGNLGEKEPFVRYNTFGDSGIHFNIFIRVKHFIDQYIIKHEFIKELKKAYEEAGITLPYPQMDVHLHNKSNEL